MEGIVSKLKVVFGLIAILGVGALTTLGASEVEVGTLVTIGFGFGTALSAIIAFLKK